MAEPELIRMTILTRKHLQPTGYHTETDCSIVSALAMYNGMSIAGKTPFNSAFYIFSAYAQRKTNT